jgi:two-component system, sensor histidine kinase ChiS
MPSSKISQEIMRSGQLRFQHLTVENGLSHNVSNHIVQDPCGFIWISTFDGLNCFDGNDIRIFRHDPHNPASLSTSFIRAMTIDGEGNLWLATVAGLNKFDPHTETAIRYQPISDDTNSLGFDFVTSIFVDRQDQIWVGGVGRVDRFDPQTKKFEHFIHDPADPNSIGPGQVHSICQDKQGVLWFGNRGGGGLSRFDPAQYGFFRYCHNPLDPTSLSDDSIHVVSVDAQGKLWVGTENGGLNYFEQEAGIFQHYLSDPGTPGSLSDNYIRDILSDQDGTLWIATSRGLNRFDRESECFDHFHKSQLDTTGISSNNISRLFEDRGSGLWVSTFSGVNYCYPEYQKFFHYRHHPFETNSMDDDNVRAIFEDESGILWIGTEGGLNRLDRVTGQVTRYGHDPDDPNGLSPYLYITAITAGLDGVLWLGLWGGELNCFDPHAEKFWHPGDIYDGPQINNILTICCDPAGNVWVGDYNLGLFCFPGGDWRQTPRHFTHDLDDPCSLSANTVKIVYADQDGTIWVGTHTGGLNRFDPDSCGFHRFVSDHRNANNLSNNWVESILQDSQGTLWVGTNAGLNRFDAETNTFRQYGEEDGLPGATIVGILDESVPTSQTQNLWLSTNQGAVKFDPHFEKFQSFGMAEGLQTRSEISGYFKNHRGEMFLGGYGGLTVFSPAEIQVNEKIPPIVLTKFLLFNQTVAVGAESHLKRAIWNTPEIQLSDQEYNFAFEFAALCFVDPTKNQYQYKLVGFDRNWITVDNHRRFAAYTNLSAGEYEFRVRGTNNHGVWNEIGAALKITVAQPLWERLRLQKEAAEATNQAKNAFLAKISHELRTPLNSILGYSQFLLQDLTLQPDQSRKLESITLSGTHLLTLVNEILELSKIEAGHLELNPMEFSLCQLLRELEAMFRLAADKKGLEMSFGCDPELPQYVVADEGKLRQVLINLLDNAVKFTDIGRVNLTVQSEFLFEEKQRATGSFAPNMFLKFAITDTGFGIAADELELVFKPFVQTTTGREARRGTGLGMPISFQYVQLMGGDLTVRSKPGRGSTFSFELPVVVDDFTAIDPQRFESTPFGLTINERDSAGNPTAIELKQMVSNLPNLWSDDLYQAFVDLDIPQIQALIEDIRPQAPELAAVFMRWANNFKYEKVMAFIRPIGKN